MPSHPARFEVEPLRDMVAVGAVGPRSVRLWLRSACPGRLLIAIRRDGEEQVRVRAEVEVPENNARDNTLSVLLPNDVPGAVPLDPLTRYCFCITRLADAHLVGTGRFETAPERPEDAPSRVSLALMSCHQPFDKRGRVLARSRQMLRAAYRCLRGHDVKLVLMVGDQMYSDCPAALSLLNPDHFAHVAPPGRKRLQDCSAEEIRRLYHRRYRVFWSLPEWQAIHADFPCYPIWDDHELVDNWGSDPVHQTAGWLSVGEGAAAAYFDYQASRVLGERRRDHFGYEIAYRDLAVYVMDLRSHRTANEGGQVFSEAQEAEFREFLNRHEEKSLLFVVLSVPPIHLIRWIAQMVSGLTPDGEDFSDRWSSRPHHRDRHRLLSLLHDHQRRCPAQRLVVLSGDIHIGCVASLEWSDGTPALYQVVSSPISHVTTFFPERLASDLAMRLIRRVHVSDELTGRVRLLPGAGKGQKNPYRGLNLSIVELETPPAGADPQVRFFLYGHRGETPVCVYQSPDF